MKDLVFSHIANGKPTKSGWYLGIECANLLKDDWILWSTYWDKDRGCFYSDPKSKVILKIDYWLDSRSFKRQER